MLSPVRQDPSFDALLATLRAVAEPSRLRLAALLSRAELTVTEISEVIGQSQPRTSRHLRLMLDAGILERSPEGPFVFYRVADRGDAAELVRSLAERCQPDDPALAADVRALERVRRERSRAAASYLRQLEEERVTLRPLCVADEEVERAMLELIAGEGAIERLLDIGTGTGRILELMAPHSERSVGLDCSREMLGLARANLAEARLSRASVRHGDLHRTPFEAGSFDVAIMHHVLHLLDDPGAAIADAATLLRPSGRLLVADYAPHQLELLRERHGHRQLGVADGEMAAWARSAGLELSQDRTLAPPARDGLTVRLWLLRAPAQRSAGALEAAVA